MLNNLHMARIPLTAGQLGVGLVILGLVMLWARTAHDRNRFAQVIFTSYSKTLHGTTVETYLLWGGLVLVLVGSLFMLGLIG